MIERPGGFQIRRFCVRPERPVVSSAEDDPDPGDATLCFAAFHRPVVESAEERDDPDAGDAALCRAALHRPVVSPAEERDDPDAGDAALCRAALRRPVVSPAEEKDDLDPGDATLCRATLHRTVVESAEVRDDPDVGDADPYRAALHRLAVESAAKRGKILEFEEAAQIDPEPEQLNLCPEVEDESDEVDSEQPPTLNLEIEDDRGRLSIFVFAHFLLNNLILQ